MSILGNRVVRKEDPLFLTKGATYVDDLVLDGAVHLSFVRSTMAHARITSIDVDEARQAPGVVAVFTAADLPLPPIQPEVPILNQSMPQPMLAKDKVRFVGEPVVAIVTEERYQGPDAAELVLVDYDPLPPVMDPESALETETLLHEEAGTNAALELAFPLSEDLFDGCDVVVRRRINNQRVAPAPLEVRGGAARWESDGRLTYWGSSQHPHTWRDEVARGLGIDPAQVRFIAPDVGGGFGAKIHSYPDDVLCCWIAQQAGRPVKWQDTRSESMVAMGHGRGQVQHIEIGGTRDGKVLAYRLTVLQDAGAYPRLGAVLPFMTRTMLTGVYDIPKAEFTSRSVVTNTTPTVAYRGAGRPEATAAVERAVDLFAAEIGMDPADVRRANLIDRAAFPFTTPTLTTYDSGDYAGALDRVLEAADYAGLRAEQARRRAQGQADNAGITATLMGIGVSTYVEITAVGGGTEFGAVEVKPDGKALVRAGTSSHGQGHATSYAMLVSDRLGIPMDDIEFVQSDTDLIPYGEGTSGSRSMQQGGVAVAQAATQLVDKARQLAGDLLEADVADVVLDPAEGRFHVAGTPAIAKTWAEVATAAAATPDFGPLGTEVQFTAEGPTFPFGAHVAVVEVDPETGKVELTRMVACDDAGTLINPLLAEGQVHGGLAQGAAQALLEEVRYDEDGNPVTSNLADYAFISAAELPSFEIVHMETPTPLNELGAKGIGESGTIGSTPAVQSAVCDALAPFGVRHVDMPATPERVWRAINRPADD
ncbi:MAG: aerobic carbon-monoxide dehydrogenase large subunit [Acidimicrobiaceae bacterium]|nr:aerobic carbon-monoxide dehydrogenase large subunit [Acidimicrobiaceae bacterium]